MFRDRAQAGRLLGERLEALGLGQVLVVGLPGGGLAVAAEVARALGATLDVVVMGKVAIPARPEMAVGAVGEGGVRLVDWAVASLAGATASEVRQAMEREAAEVRGRAHLLRGQRPPIDLTGRSVVIVDDGVATGATMTAAVRVVRELGAGEVVVAAPVAPPDVVAALAQIADEVVVLDAPTDSMTVDEAYEDFPRVDDSEAAGILAGERHGQAAGRRPPPTRSDTAQLATNGDQSAAAMSTL